MFQSSSAREIGSARARFMSDMNNRARVLDRLSYVSDEVRDAINFDIYQFMSQRGKYMTKDQIAEMDRVINRVKKSAQRAIQRRNMTPEQRKSQNERDRERKAQARSNLISDQKMSIEQRSSQNECARESYAEAQVNRTQMQSTAGKERERKRMSERRANMTPQQKAAQKERNRELYKKARANITPELRAAKKERDRKRMSERRAKMTPEQKAAQNERDRKRMFRLRAKITPEQKAVLLQNERNRKRRKRISQVRANMTELKTSAVGEGFAAVGADIKCGITKSKGCSILGPKPESRDLEASVCLISEGTPTFVDQILFRLTGKADLRFLTWRFYLTTY